jgi:DNA-binding NtrC family response regulator
VASPSDTVRILVVDDDRAMGEMLVEGLAAEGRVLRAVADAAVADISATEHDVIVTDLRMPGLDGLELCRRVVARVERDVPVIVLTAFGDYDTAVAAMRAGAYDFLSKPVKLDVLELAVARAIEHSRLRREVRRLQATLARTDGFGGLVGSSAAMQPVYTLLQRVADSESAVLVTGESGTGKELVARALHAASARADKPFVSINCAAMPEALLESELFGRGPEKGAFSAASGGTLFLDEIGDLPLALQPQLLRALQEPPLRHARIVAATTRDLETAIDEGRFREDLYFRIDVIEVALPPLRARGNDVLGLAQHFLVRESAKANKGVVGFSTPVAKHLVDYDWPGNVRELHNVIERAVALATCDHITVDDLPEKLLKQRAEPRIPLPLEPGQLVTLDEMERRYILHVLEASNGSRTVAARTLGLDRSTLWRKLERLRVAAAKA